MIGMFRPGQLAATEDGSVHPDFYRWLRDLYLSVSTQVQSTVTEDYTAIPGDFVPCDPSGGGFTVTLPPANIADGLSVTIKNITSSVNAIIVAAQSGDMIDDAVSFSMTSPYGSRTVRRNGTAWFAV